MGISIDGTTATLTFDDCGYCSVTKAESNCCCNTSTSTNVHYDALSATSASTVSNTYARPAYDSISTTIDTKVDKSEFITEVNKINNKINKLSNAVNGNEEDNRMKGLNFDFGPVNGNVARMSIYGMAVKNRTGAWVSYDEKTGEIMDVDVLNFDGSKFLYKMPVAIKDVAVGDIVIHMNVPMFVTKISEDGKSVFAVDPVVGERKEILLTKSPFGFNFITKIVNFVGNAFGSATADNPFGNMGMLMMMSESGNDFKDMLPLILMANGGNIDMSNPLMMYALLGDKGNDMLPWMFLMNSNKPTATECHCGGSCGQHNN
jgi:hypothetical protein